MQPEDASLTLLTPVPEEQLNAWLAEFYGKPVQITKRVLLRHRDLSYVERLTIANALPSSIIYKLVLPPWDIEQELHERVLIPSITNSAQLFLSAHHGTITALFLEDVGTENLVNCHSPAVAAKFGKELARLHRSYGYRIDELKQLKILRTIFPRDYENFAQNIVISLMEWDLIDRRNSDQLAQLAHTIAETLAQEPASLVHGDLYAENIITRDEHLYIVDWSWFTVIGAPIMDLATVTADHFKNGSLCQFKNEIIEAYCDESGRDAVHVKNILPQAATLSRLMFLDWLAERRKRGILGTTVGPVDTLIQQVVQELCRG